MAQVTIIQGHPDPEGGHLCHAMADAYASGVADGGNDVRRIEVAKLEFPLIRSQHDFVDVEPPPVIRDAQQAILDAGRIVVTMGMPVFAYRRFFGAHSLKSFERNILKLSGIKPVRESLYGMVDQADDEKRKEWLAELYQLGLDAE